MSCLSNNETVLITDQKFIYNRDCAPLYFVPYDTRISDTERQRRIRQVNKEYFTSTLEYENEHLTILSNGMSRAEYAIYVISESYRNTAS